MKYVANPVIVNAFQISQVEPMPPADPPLQRHLLLDDEKIVVATPEMMSRMEPQVGDYWVIQSDGYTYLNPKEVFERKYSPIQSPVSIESLATSSGKSVLSPTEVMSSGTSGTFEPPPGISAPAGDHTEPAAVTSVAEVPQTESTANTESSDVESSSEQPGLVRCTSCGTWVNHMNVCPGCGAQLSLQER